MLKQAWKPVTASLVVGIPAYYYYSTSQGKSKLSKSLVTNEAFDIQVRVRSATGRKEMATRSIPLLSAEGADVKIRENATTSSMKESHPRGAVWRHATAFLAANDPIEDANAHAHVMRDEQDPSAPGDLLFFAVMDGHSGRHTSQLLSKTLISAVMLELNELVKIGQNDKLSQSQGGVTNAITSLWKSPSWTPDTVTKSIKDAFSKFDTQLILAPINAFVNTLAQEDLKGITDMKNIPDLSNNEMAKSLMQVAITGSCALLAVLDTSHQDLYVALSGDCRAVAGVWEAGEGATEGYWKAEVLTEDQTGRNPKEKSRIQSEHPANEANTVIRNGRILGGLEPSRAFGDARYKWPKLTQQILSQAFKYDMRETSPYYLTPPYVTATPVVTHMKYNVPKAGSGSGLRFLVLATDGLWDQLSSEDVVSLVGGYLSGIREKRIPKSELATRVPLKSGTSGTIEGKTSTRRKAASEGTWTFVDDNISAHLIRNAFGGGDDESLRKLLSIPAPLARSFRDDVTVTVVWFDESQQVGGVAKAKL